MDFYAVLDQVVDLLRQRGRVTYRALKRQFHLDDDVLDDLKEELIKAQRVAADENGDVLVWVGAVGSPPAPTPPSPQPAQRPAAEVNRGAPIEAPAAEPRTVEAERRQLTVLFCDLVDSTALASQLDPEDWREVVRAYQDTCAKVIARFEGHIAQYLGDGLLVYFGYPRAHEDDAQRAVRTGLGMVEAMGALPARWPQEAGGWLAVRVGIHTGLVVVGEMGGGTRQEPLALGDTPNIAARLQSLAPPNAVVISERTRQLVGATFDLEALGPQPLKGVTTPLSIYGVRGERVAESRFEAAGTAARTPLVGREEELALVLRRWAQARAGEGQVVLLTGEPGIGKSRLLQAVRERVAAEPHIRLAYQCSPYHANSAFYPVMAQLEHAAHFEPGDPPAQKLDKLEALLAQGTTQMATVAPLVAALWSLTTGDRYPPLALSPERQKAHTIAALVDHAAGLSRHSPVLCLVEDAHWCDPTTLEVLDQLVHRVPELPVLVLITARPEFAAPWTASHMTTLPLTRLARAHIAAMVAHLTAAKALPSEVLAQILARTDGVPLFVEELTKTILESGLLREGDERYVLTGPLPPLAIPASVQDSLMARLDRLAPVKGVAQLGAALGREFTYELLKAVSPADDSTLQQALGRLVDAELLYQQGVPPQATYLFKHALIQDAAYQALLKSRRQHIHQRIAQVLEERFPEACKTQPELLAHHYTQAGFSRQAVSYWQRAGQRAVQHSAYAEAISHLTTAIALLRTLPDTPARSRQELDLQLTLGPALIATKGQAAPEVEQVYARARELGQHVRETPHLFQALWGLASFYLMKPELQTSRELGEQLLRLAQHAQDPALLLEAHRSLGTTLFESGALVQAQVHLEQGIALYNPQQHRAHAILYGRDPGVVCLAYGAQARWLLGYPDQALQRIQDALTLHGRLSHPFSFASALFYAAILAQFCRDVQAAREQTEALMTLSTEEGFPLRLANGIIIHGWALAAQHEGEQGLAEMRRGLSAYAATGAYLTRPYFLALLAEGYGHVGQPEEGLSVLANALAAVQRYGERFYEAELYRLKGDLLLALAGEHAAEAEACFRRALEVARHQQAKSLELRAALSLSWLWQRQGKRERARNLLTEIYGWFTEGFDTADLQEANALLEELS
jgi:TOMM system kinase/cyclase fusion protein